MLMLNVITDGLRTMFAFLSKYIYELIAILYDLFIDISRVKILSSSQIEPIYQRLTIIITIVMVFYVTFQTVKYVVQPEQFSDKEQGAQKIVLKMVLVVVLIAFVPKIFEWANTFQNKIFDTQIISKVIIGHGDTDVSKFGKNISYNIFNTFYGTNSESFTIKELVQESNCEEMPCEQVVNINLSKLQQEGKIPLIFTGLNEQGEIIEPTTGNEVKEYYISFNGLLAVVVGGFIAYILLMYCIDVGVRVIQLAFLQIIAPIPIMGYLSPKKDGMFEKWVRQCITTYLDVFLRLAIIYFVLLICEILGEAIANNSLVTNVNGLEWAIYVALILGLLLFAKKAPDLLKDILPKSLAASGSFGLKAKERFAPVRGLMKPTGRIAGAATGAVMGAAAGVATGIGQGIRRSKALGKDGKQKGVGAGIWGATKGAIGGLVGGTARGIYNGGKKGNVFKNSVSGAQKQIQANQKFGNREESGYTLGHQMEDRTRGLFGAKSRIESQEASKAPITRHDEALKKVADTRSQIEKRALDKITESGKGGDAAKNYAQNQRRLKELQEDQTVRDREFKVAKYKDEATARAAYEANVVLAKASINKSNFIDPTNGKFDQTSYDAAVKAAASKVKASDYSVAYQTQEEADAAYEAAVQAKKDAVDRSQYATDAEYEQAKLDAAATVSKDMYIKGYATQEEADRALGEEIQLQRKAVDDAKDAAVAEYINTVDDGAIDSMLTTLAAEINEYNTTAEENTYKKDTNGNIIRDASGQAMIEKGRKILYTDDLQNNGAIDTTKIKSNFIGFSDYVKKGNIKVAQDKNTNDLVSINAEINRIKNETSGSGFGDKK